MITVAIVAPGRRIDERVAELVHGVNQYYSDKIELRFHPQCFFSDHHFAGTDDQRTDALVEVANDPSVDAVWFAKGGYGACRLLPALTRFDQHAYGKTWLGYSDAGFLLGALARAGIGQPVHAPMPADIMRDDRGAVAIARVLEYLLSKRNGTEPSCVDGPALAFNTVCLASLLGTPHAPDFAGRTLMLEEVGEYEYRFDRLLFQITSNPAVQQARGIRLGRVSAVPENDVPFGMDAEAITQYWCAKNHIPYLGRADIGHDSDNKIVPFDLSGGL